MAGVRFSPGPLAHQDLSGHPEDGSSTCPSDLSSESLLKEGASAKGNSPQVHMKNQKGFIQIPILITIIAGVLVLGGGYFGVKQYQNYQIEQTKKERVAQEKEKETQVLTEAQQKALEEAGQEIEKLKEGSAESKKKQQVLEQKLQNEQQKSEQQNLSISASELESYLLGVVMVVCYPQTGSGSLWQLPNFGGFVVLTNKHVVDGFDSCVITFERGDGVTKGSYTINTKEVVTWNNFTDIGVLKLEQQKERITLYGETPMKDLNYKISELRKCTQRVAIGYPVVVIGYPAFGIRYVNLYNQGFKQYIAYRIASDGIISGHDTSVVVPQGNLPYPNYFVSAKIDSGNSGGIAISKDEKGLCVLGIPTWLTLGKYETQGLVQNIHNVMYRP